MAMEGGNYIRGAVAALDVAGFEVPRIAAVQEDRPPRMATTGQA